MLTQGLCLFREGGLHEVPEVLPQEHPGHSYDEASHHNGSEGVRQRVDGISHHGGTTAGEADAELQDGEEDIDQAAKKGNPVNFFFPRRNDMIRMLGQESIGTSGSLLCYRKGTKKY